MPIGGATPCLHTEAGWVGIGAFVENKTGDWRTFMPVIDVEKCIGCQFCWFYCPEGCITMENKKAKVDYDYCKGCGICANECPAKAISMQREVRA
ncbi:MAG: 4Fe-4S dicluster-binding protein [Candidatus Thermoplasmatota archaeon]